MGFGNEVAAALAVIREEKRYYKDYVPRKAVDAGNKLTKAVDGLWEDVLDTVVELVKAEIPWEYPHVGVWWYSVLLKMKKDPLTFQDFVKYVRKNQQVFSENTQYFLWYQLKSMLFRCQQLDHPETKEELWKFFQEIVENFAERAEVPLEEIPAAERKEDFVLVITEQFLAVQHGPTKTVLDRCKILLTEMHKKVLLLNTAEAMSFCGKVAFCGAVQASYDPSKLSEREQYWKGVTVPYHQCRQNMPDMEVLNQLLADIRKLAPARVISIGGSGMLANLVNKMIPVLALELVPSGLGFTSVRYQTLGRKLTSEDRELLSRVGYDETHVIESVFTSSLKPQTERITREVLGVPEDKFLMVVVGARLDDEVTDEFLEMLDGMIEKDMFLGFLGNFPQYAKRISKFPHLKEQSANFGFCQDILSRMEVCDLYVNPIRKGGGTSCVEAMFKGVPVVTVGYGDVSVNAGQDFWVKDYSGMKERILQLYTDKEYYKEMSEKAEKRTEILLDTATEFAKIMNEADKREKQRQQQAGGV